MEDTVKIYIDKYVVWRIHFSFFDRLLHQGRIVNIKKRWILID